jgi:hypothetical protein
MDNNVINNHPDQIVYGDSRDGTVVNLDEWRAKGFDVHSAVGVMPKFENAAASDYSLAAGSAGIGMGASLPDMVPTDIDGVPRPQGKASDCGCYETESGGPTSQER